MAKVKTNQFVLLGRVGWKDEIKFFENGTCKQTIQLGVKKSQDKYHNFLSFCIGGNQKKRLFKHRKKERKSNDEKRFETNDFQCM